MSFVKTLTGFGPSGATVEDVALMKSVAGLQIGVKALGRIRLFGNAIKMIQAGATRIGTLVSVTIVLGEKTTT